MTMVMSTELGVSSLDGGLAILVAAAASGLAAGPATATAVVPFTVAGDSFGEALEQKAASPDASQHSLLGLRDLRDACYARAREAAVISAVPWPIVFAPLGFLINGVKAMSETAYDLLATMSGISRAADTIKESAFSLAVANPCALPLHRQNGAKAWTRY